MGRIEPKRYRALKEEEAHLTRLIEDACGLPGRTMDGMPQAGKTNDPTAEAAERIGAMRTQLQAVQKELRRIEEAIGRVTSSTEREILRYRYIDGLAWAQIARIMHYCESHVKRLHGRAIKKIR